MKLNLKQIRIDGETQSREKINENAIKEYTESYLDGAVFPPMEVFYDGVNYYLVNGFHRFFMYQRTNTEEVEVKVHKGTLRDAQFYSLGVNDDNGLRRTIADKCKAVKTAFDDIEWSDLSDNKIAKQCKVSHTFVSNLRKKLSIERQASKTVTMRGKKTTMDTTNIGKKPAKEGPEAPKENPEIEESIKDYDPKDDQIIELSTSNEDLRAQNEAYKAKEMILSGDQAKIDDEITGLRNQIKALEAELRAVKNSRDQFQAKNAELIKQVNYYKKQLDKIKQ